MQRRQLLRQTALAVSAFSLSRELFAMTPAERRWVEGRGIPPADLIKLSSNENPHGPSPLARKAMADAVNISNRYQWDMNGVLRERIGALSGHSKDNVILGAGSSELLGLACTWAALRKGNVVASEPTFKLWMTASRRIGLQTKLVPLTATKHNDLQRMADTMDADTRMVYLCNPNNPTGTTATKTELEDFVRKVAKDRILLMDEAYTEYYDSPSVSHLVNEFPNLLIAKTFSKVFGMAGARVGYILAQPDTIKKLSECSAWANAGPSAVSMTGAMAALTDSDFVKLVKRENHKAKELFCQGLEKAGIPYIPSVTSFVYFDNQPYAKKIPELLATANIIGARAFEDKSTWLRLSVGTVPEMQKVVSLLQA
ncbi:MAG: aminotransferase class I/II-fold pyridoxal phosphate-dependent enzyme [Chitinophagia bacterium]|nr:aminotransferase class I/II-fold pyridoxal phosphate-dependent enzyme [Chitinophagia bacterium]